MRLWGISKLSAVRSCYRDKECLKPIDVSGSQTHFSVEIQFQSSSRCVKRRNLRNIVVLTLTLLLLKFEWDTVYRSTLNVFHQMGGETGNFVAQTFWWYRSLFSGVRMKIDVKEKSSCTRGHDFIDIDDSLVGVEVERQRGITSKLELMSPLHRHQQWTHYFSISTWGSLGGFTTVLVRTRPYNIKQEN